MESPFPTDLRALVNDAISFGLDARQIDALVAISGINFLNPAKPVPALIVPLSGAPAFELFVNDGQARVVFIGGITRFVSIFPPKPKGFPLARVYLLPVPDLLEFAQVGRSFEERGIRVAPMRPEEFNAALEADKYEQRIADYCAAYKRRTKHFANLTRARLASTIVEHGAIFYSKGCILCGRDAGLLTTTIGDPQGGEGLMLGFYACPKHAAEANNDVSFFSFLSRSFGQPSPKMVGHLSREFLLEAVADFLRTQLDCQIIKLKGGTITAKRPSGFRIVVRLGANGDYAYVFFNADGLEVARIDNANHHQVPYGPDHLHCAPAQNNKAVVPSFTYGLPAMDAKILRRILAEHGG